MGGSGGEWVQMWNTTGCNFLVCDWLKVRSKACIINIRELNQLRQTVQFSLPLIVTLLTGASQCKLR